MAEPIGNWVMGAADADRDDLDCELIDLKQWDLPFYHHPKPPAAGDYADAKQIAWGGKVASADGFILIAPEYNHGIPAVLKNALDTVYAEWNRKPVAFVAYGGMAARARWSSSPWSRASCRWRRWRARSTCRAYGRGATATGSAPTNARARG